MTLAPRDLAPFIEHTLLRPEATAADVDLLCEEAVGHGFCGVCVNPVHIARASRALAGQGPLPVCVVGFPLGATLTRVKAWEAGLVADLGAREIDMVLNIGAFRAGERALAGEDVAAVVRAAAGAPVKVILETALLTEPDIVAACRLAVEAGAAFVKTSTGFGPGGATVEAVGLMRQTVGPGIGVKASGGIASYAQALAMVEAGASRIGSSASLAIVSD